MMSVIMEGETSGHAVMTPTKITAGAPDVHATAQPGAGCPAARELWGIVIVPPVTGVATMDSPIIAVGASLRHQAGAMMASSR